MSAEPADMDVADVADAGTVEPAAAAPAPVEETDAGRADIVARVAAVEAAAPTALPAAAAAAPPAALPAIAPVPMEAADVADLF